jgi:hypothetical protein
MISCPSPKNSVSNDGSGRPELQLLILTKPVFISNTLAKISAVFTCSSAALPNIPTPKSAKALGHGGGDRGFRGDPETPLHWVSRSQRIAHTLFGRGFQVSQKLVGLLPPAADACFISVALPARSPFSQPRNQKSAFTSHRQVWHEC